MKIGILGTGMIAKELLSIGNKLTGITISAICNVRWTKEDIKEFANSNNIKYGYNDMNDFLNSNIDTVYVALPNNLHFSYAKQALEAGKHVILEKPFTTNYKEAVILSEIARKKQLFLWEAISNQYLPNYKKIKELLPSIGNVKIVNCNYSQYSSRYDRFKDGIILPAFDPDCAGGALMDLNIYNIHYVVGLFGKPKDVFYYPNIERNIDTSGILVMEYENFVCTCIGAKDCKAPISNTIQGDKGCIIQNSPSNTCQGFEVLMNDGTKMFYDENVHEHRMVNEFLDFESMYEGRNFDECYIRLNHTLNVCDVLTKARYKAGLLFPFESKEDLL